MSFIERYGPWAVVTGASEGTGREFARQIAAEGVPSILIARREAPLAALVEEIRGESGVECIAAAIDLAAPDAFDRIAEAVGEREVGLFVSNAGADPNGARFLDRDIETWMQLVQRNSITMMRCCHHFAGPMQLAGGAMDPGFRRGGDFRSIAYGGVRLAPCQPQGLGPHRGA